MIKRAFDGAAIDENQLLVARLPAQSGLANRTAEPATPGDRTFPSLCIRRKRSSNSLPNKSRMRSAQIRRGWKLKDEPIVAHEA